MRTLTGRLFLQRLQPSKSLAIHEHRSTRESIDYVEFPADSPQSLDAVKRFYKEVFGWSFQDWGDDYSDTRNGGTLLALAPLQNIVQPGHIGSLFSSTLEAARERVLEAGGKIAKEIISFPGGRRFEYVDPAGNRLAVWSEK